jgi:hypothetical protein
MQTQAKLQVLPVVSDIGNFNFAVVPSAVVGGITSNKYAATSLTFNPSTNVITMNTLSVLSENVGNSNINFLTTGSVNVGYTGNIFVGTTRVESQIPHPFLLSFL